MKNLASNNLRYNYHGYSIQDFLKIDGRFASDGLSETAEKELRLLIDSAHGIGIYVILDVVINHSGRVFDYFNESTGERLSNEHGDYQDLKVLNDMDKKALKIKWTRWVQDHERPSFCTNSTNHPVLPSDDIDRINYDYDSAIWPTDLRQAGFFRRRGRWNPKADQFHSDGNDLNYTKGDFDNGMRQFLFFSNDDYSLELKQEEYGDIKNRHEKNYGNNPALNILIRSHEYLIAKYDFDGFRIDTTKHISPKYVEIFGNAIREFALSIGKKNFFTFGEIAVGSDKNSENRLASHTGRNSGSTKEGFGIDSAADYPLFEKLRMIAKGFAHTQDLIELFKHRREQEKNLLSSHGEASRFFVTFIDNHDQNTHKCDEEGRVIGPDKGRFLSHVPENYREPQLTLALGLLFCLPGIPCLYYGTEQGLSGIMDESCSAESVREALWGRGWTKKKEAAFDRENFFYRNIRCLSDLRNQNPALRYGRYYFREISGNGKDFGLPYRSEGGGDLIAFSRILSAQEILIVANTANHNTDNKKEFKGYVIVAVELYSRLYEQGIPLQMEMVYSNAADDGCRSKKVDIKIETINFFTNNPESPTLARAAKIPINLKLMEIQIWKLTQS